MRLIYLIILALMPAIAIAAPFDPEAATQAYLSTLKGAARANSDAYFEGGYWLLLWGTLVGIAIDWIMLRTGWSARFRDWAERVTKRRFFQSMLWTLPYLVVSTVLGVTWTIYTGYFREKQYGLLDQSFGAWAGEQAIGLAIGFAFFPLVVALVMAGIRRSPKRWWLVGTGIAGLFIAFFVMITPVFISPLFNTYTELPAGPVRDRIVAMAASKNVPSDHIYVFDQSKQHKRISANVSGLGPTIRISLNDNLLKRTSMPEIIDVMGHEMGHYVLNHSVKLSVLFALLFGFSFWVASLAAPWMIGRWGSSWGLRGIDDVAAWPVYSIIIAALTLAITPVRNTIVRMHESEADAFGLEVGREPDGFAKIAMKLSEYRKIEPGPIEEFVFFDHPSGRTRVRMAMDWKAKNLPTDSSPQ